ncbi:MAG: hypothetical protein WBL06_12030 [Pseudolysinimonas sp.]|uniref:hypothetical protein n=1 Tax=Pseudolysinimonas sp. TaxID=2680009 RepID=UPI003C706DD1
MFHLIAISTPGPDGGVDPNTVTPGVAGFVVTILFAAAVIVLVISMARRTRRVIHRAAANERLDAEEAAGESREA